MGFCNKVSGTISIPYKQNNVNVTSMYCQSIIDELPFYGEDNFPFLSREFFHINLINQNRITDNRSQYGGGYKWFTISCGFTLKEIAFELSHFIAKWEKFLSKFDVVVDSDLYIDLTPYHSTVHYNWKGNGENLKRTGPPIELSEILT